MFKNFEKINFYPPNNHFDTRDQIALFASITNSSRVNGSNTAESKIDDVPREGKMRRKNEFSGHKALSLW